MSAVKHDVEVEEEVQVVDPQLKFFMKSVNGQFAQFQNFIADMREELQEIRANQRGNDEEYHGESYNFRGARFHPMRGGRGRGGGGRGIPNQQYVHEEAETEVTSSGQVDGNLGTIKMKMPEFKGNNNADEYLEWERKVEMIFECQNYSEEKKVKLAAVEFTGYAMFWWDQLNIKRRKKGMRPILTWEAMKEAMRHRFVPTHYFRELHQKLHRLVQGGKSVEEYHKEMEMCMVRANIEEDEEVTMARFLGGLNKEIADAIELYKYDTFEEMLDMAMKIEKQKKGKSTNKFQGNPSNTWGSKWSKRDEKKEFKGSKPQGADSATKGKEVVQASFKNGKGNFNSSTPSREIKCFKCLGKGHIVSQCPNKRVMIAKENGEVVSESECSDDDMPSLIDADSDCDSDSDKNDVLLAEYGESLVARRALNMQVKEESLEQRENIFHTRCLVNGKVCTMIIDGGSCTNVASVSMVEKLNLACDKHPRPYRLQW